MPYFPLVHGKFRAIAYLVWQERDAVLIDPPQDMTVMQSILESSNLHLHALLCTHMHVDHVVGCGTWQTHTGLPVFAAREDIEAAPTMLNRAPLYDMTIDPFSPTPLAEGRHIWGKLECHAILIPGHSPGGFCFHFPTLNLLCSGDSLFKGVPSRTDFPESLPEQLVPSLKNKIFPLPPETLVFPGHGKTTTVGEEARI